MTDGGVPVSLAIFAAGVSRRMFGDVGGHKAMLDVGGNPLVSYVIDECLALDICRVVLVTNSMSGRELREWADARPDIDLVHVLCDQLGTLPAVTKALEGAGNAPCVLATCDLFGAPGALRRWVARAFSMSDRHDLIVASASVSESDSLPIWLKHDDAGNLTEYSKALLDGRSVAVGLRVLSRSPLLNVKRLDMKLIATDSELMNALIRSGFRAAIMESPGVFDVDTPADLVLARRIASEAARGGAHE